MGKYFRGVGWFVGGGEDVCIKFLKISKVGSREWKGRRYSKYKVGGWK